MAFVLPGIHAAPMFVEGLLQLAHLVPCGLLGILLHAGVDGGIDFQTVGIEVNAVIAAPFFQVVGQGLAEVGGLTVVDLLYAVVQFNLFDGEGVEGFLCQVSVLEHVVEHHVATAHAVVRMQPWVIGGRGLEHAHEDGSLVGGEVFGGNAEVGLTGRLDAERVGAEVHGVGIHGENLFFREVPFQLQGRYPFLAFHDQHLHPGDIAQQTRGVFRAYAEEVLGQLLGDGRGPAWVLVNDDVLHHGEERLKVNAPVVIETLIFGVDEGFPEHGVHFLVLHGRAVLAEELANHHAVGTVNLGRLGRSLVDDGTHGGRLAEEEEKIDVDGSEIEDKGNDN